MRAVSPNRLRSNMAFLTVVLITATLAFGQDTSPASPPSSGQNTSAPPANPNNAATVPAQGQGQAQGSSTPAPQQEPAAQQPNDSAPQNQQSAQPTASDDQGTFVFKKQVQEVVLHATVVDGEKRLVTNLDKNAFSIFENGAPETTTSFRREDVPVALGIVVDNSGSMRDKREKVNQAVLNLIRASNPLDEVFVVNFSQTYYLDQDFTSDINLLKAALNQVSMQGSTALYDAIVASAVHLKNNPRLDKKVLLVITDGQDNMSQETLQQAMKRLGQTNGPTLYAIGLTGEGLTGKGRDALQSLAESTGGAAYFPQSLDDVDTITRTVAHDIRSQYTLAYKPPNLSSKKGYQTIRVDAKAPGYAALTVRTRNGYYAGEAIK